ncbi:MAG TPA: phosphoribosyltransferase family protein, partial [Chryseosolibacter sp.]
MFQDRKEAGEKLAIALEKFRNTNPVILGIPRGGAETAYYVARHLNAELALLVSRKLGFPFDPEAAFGAVAEDGSVYISDTRRHSLSANEINESLKEEKKEIKRRIQALRRGRPLPDLDGRTIILVDDGIATGATLFAAVELCRKQKAAKIVVAAPIAGRAVESVLRSRADDVVILETPPSYHAVSQGYRFFEDLTDQEAVDFADRWEKE